MSEHVYVRSKRILFGLYQEIQRHQTEISGIRGWATNRNDLDQDTRVRTASQSLVSVG